jgi:hypothetical protein
MSLAVPTGSSESSDSSNDPAVESAVSRLREEFGRLGTQVVVRVVRDCRRELGGSPIGALPELVERLARYRLNRDIA